MESVSLPKEQKASFQHLVDVAIRIGLLFLLASWCLDIVRPFLLPVIWGTVLAVAFYPLYRKISELLGGRPKVGATAFSLLAVALLVIPSYFFFASIVASSMDLVQQVDAGKVEIPDPPASLEDLPFYGKQLHAAWLDAARDPMATLKRYGPEIEALIRGAAGRIAGLGGDILQFVFSLLIMGVLLATSSSGASAFRSIARRLIGDRGEEFAQLTTDTIRNVGKGVVGVALIQTFLCGVGLVAAGIPAAGLWILLILILAVIQLPPLLILLPIIIYQFNTVGTVPAVIFTVWSLIAGGSDTFLKPIFLGRGMKTPMLVILIGALGGMIWAGIIGLFLGAVILSLSYELFLAWLHADPGSAEPTP